MTMSKQKSKSPNWDAMFDDLVNDSPFVKMAFNGFSGSGKTYLSAQVAIGLYKKIGSTKPILINDTEKAFRAIKDLFDSAGIPVKVSKSRSLSQVEKCFDACEDGYADILIVDSVTHIWQEFLAAYMEAKSKRFKRKVTKLSFADWGYLKPEWKRRFSDRVVNGSLHVIFTGRAGYEYDHEADEETGKMTELRKTGIKMKAETELAYEPDCLVLTEIHEELMGEKKRVYRTATILKDRYRMIDSQVFTNATFKDFEPMIDRALDGTYQESKPGIPDTFEELESKSKDWVKRRDVALEEIENLFPHLGWGTSGIHKKLKLELINRTFLTTSWTAIKNKPVDELEGGLEKLKKFKDTWLAYLQECADSEEGIKVDEKVQPIVIMNEIYGEPINATELLI